MKKRTTPYGSWESAITSELIVKNVTHLGNILLSEKELYWAEQRPDEGGRVTLFRMNSDGKKVEITPAPYNVRTRVHEYGGAAYYVYGSNIYFSNCKDNLLYCYRSDGEILPITCNSSYYYADATADKHRDRLYWVREDHTNSDIFAENSIVAMDLDGGNERVVVSGSDFYSNPRVSPNGKQLAYITWNHPNMPWDSTELWVADIDEDGLLSSAKKVAGGKNESVCQPVWSPDGVLYFISDKSNWWNIMRLTDGRPEAVCPMEAEFGSAAWVFGISNYVFTDETRIIAAYSQKGIMHLAVINVTDGSLTPIETKYTQFSSLSSNGAQAAFIAASPTLFPRIIRMTSNGGDCEIVKTSTNTKVSDDYLSIPLSIEYPTEDGKTAHALYYQPKNPGCTAPSAERPPLLIMVHGGPTGSASSSLNLKIQYWTSRGIAVADINYGGSTGYGREYRNRLRGNWGVVDVWDCANAVRFLADKGRIDPKRVAITGGSAGGYTALASLIFTELYKAGASYYGISELEIFTEETHKFESRYMDSLLGPYPEAKQIYKDRSPINFTERLSCPVIFFQGLEDKIVPPAQSELMVEALRKRRLPVAYLTFEGEGHGFRIGKNIMRALDSEFYFYSKIFGFEPTGDIEPVHIENL